MSGRLAGKRAIVSGAAGGIGSAASRAFVREGAIVGLLDRPGSDLQAVASELGEAAVALPCDLTDAGSVEACMQLWQATQPALDIVYLCAGVQDHENDGPVTEVGLDTWRRTFAVNSEGLFLSLKHSLPLIIASGGGSVIVCGSPTAMTFSGAGYSAYSASKAAAMALCRIVAADYAPHGVRANVIVPGTTSTPLIQSLMDDPGTRASLLAGTPIGRLATPEDLVGMAVFLASDESAYATGGVFAVDGGLTQR